jgi:ribonuclease P protein subunit POP4
MRTQENIKKHELIGLHAKITKSRNSDNICVQGKIVDETLHTLVIENAGKDKRVFKKCVELELNLDGEKVQIQGTEIEGRPWDRIKK